MNIFGIILLFAALGFFIFVYRVEKERDRLKYILPLITAFAVMGFALIFRENIIEFPIPGVGTIKTVAQQTLYKAKVVEEISKTVEETRKTVMAQSETIGLVAKQANEMKPEISRVAGEVQKFEVFLHDTRKALQDEYQILSQEIAFLKLQNDLPILTDKAISQGDRGALEEILRIAQTSPDNSPIKPLAREHYIGVVMSLPSQYHSSPFLVVKLEDGTLKREGEIPTTRLITSLSDVDWNVRARAAMLLGGRSEKGVPDILLQVTRTDKNLRVIGNALISFGYITKRVARPIAAGQAAISQTQFIEMYDIDKLEQWWKEHFTEVNERLTDMK
jgi:hypothetical protein